MIDPNNASALLAIRELDLLESMQKIAGDDAPDSYGQFIHCPFIDHDDRTPSFRVHEDGFFKCFGCQRGGDIVKFTMAYIGMERQEAISHLRIVLGVGNDIEAVIARAKADRQPKDRNIDYVVNVAIRDVEDSMIGMFRPYLLSHDPIINDLASLVMDHLEDEIGLIRMLRYDNMRSGRQAVRKLRRYCRNMFSYIEKEVERMTSRDRVDVVSSLLTQT